MEYMVCWIDPAVPHGFIEIDVVVWNTSTHRDQVDSIDIDDWNLDSIDMLIRKPRHEDLLEKFDEWIWRHLPPKRKREHKKVGFSNSVFHVLNVFLPSQLIWIEDIDRFVMIPLGIFNAREIF